MPPCFAAMLNNVSPFDFKTLRHTRTFCLFFFNMSLPADPVLTVWQLLRLQTLLRMLRSNAVSATSDDSNDGGEASQPRLVNIHFQQSSVVQSFVEKSFDQLCEVCAACGWVVEAHQPKGLGGVAVSLFKTVPASGGASGDAASPLTVDDADMYIAAVDEALVARCVAGEWSVEQAVQNVVESAGSLWSNMLSLSTLAPSDPMMSQLGMMGAGGGEFNPEMFKMMLAAGTKPSTAAAAGPSEDDAALKDALHNGVKVSLVVGAGDAGRGSATYDDTTKVLRVVLPISTTSSPASQLCCGVALAMEKAVEVWHAASARHAGYRPAQRGGGAGVPPLLLFAAVISGDRKQRSSLLRFPRPLLEQVLWYLSSTEQRDDAAPPIVVAEGCINAAQYLRHVAQHRLEVEFPQPIQDEEPLEEESDEAYFARIRPKTYLDLCASYLPSRIKN
jgi:hypothetical protein